MIKFEKLQRLYKELLQSNPEFLEKKSKKKKKLKVHRGVSLYQKETGCTFNVAFRYKGKQYRRSLKVNDKALAKEQAIILSKELLAGQEPNLLKVYNDKPIQ